MEGLGPARLMEQADTAPPGYFDGRAAVRSTLEARRKTVFARQVVRPDTPDPNGQWSLDTSVANDPMALMHARTRFLPLRRSDGVRGGLYEDLPAGRAAVERLVAGYPEQSDRMKLAGRATFNSIATALLGGHLTAYAQTQLVRAQPAMSARQTLWKRQAIWLGISVFLLAVWGAVQPSGLFVLLNALFAFFYLSVGMARLIAVFTPLPRQVDQVNTSPRIPDNDLPTYSVLVPIYDEVAMVPQLVQALCALDYPADKLDILILCEEDDQATRAALAAQPLPDFFSVIAVPPSLPRTKPKALNVGLALSRGTYVTIYDAEDRPDPGQLRCAVQAFNRDKPRQSGRKGRGDKGLACVQAALNITNAKRSFFTRHFALEYMALFDAFLPALSHFNLPIPLGGTSNHFRRLALLEAGGWDPFNVTEDADLGVRLTRLGYRTHVIASTTYETAPVTFRPWLQQRARWFKGWWQTWLVHMRNPVLLMHQLGVAGFVAFQTIMLGVLISVLIHPFFLVATVWAMSGLDGSLYQNTSPSGQALITVNLANFVLGYLAVAALSGVGAQRRGARGIMPVLLSIPLYWLCLSAAGFVALWELVFRPHHWNKTPHE